MSHISNLILGSTSQNTEKTGSDVSEVYIQPMEVAKTSEPVLSVFWLVLPRIKLEMSLPSHSGLYHMSHSLNTCVLACMCKHVCVHACVHVKCACCSSFYQCCYSSVDAVL